MMQEVPAASIAQLVVFFRNEQPILSDYGFDRTAKKLARIEVELQIGKYALARRTLREEMRLALLPASGELDVYQQKLFAIVQPARELFNYRLRPSRRKVRMALRTAA